MAARVSFEPGDGTLTRRILKRCRKEGARVQVETKRVRIGRGRFGSKTTAYVVPKVIHDEEVARRTEERRVAKEQAGRLRDERRIQARQERISNLTKSFPQLSATVIERLAESGKPVHHASESGYQYGVATRTYWWSLGFSVSGEPTSYVAAGRRAFDAYSTHQLAPRRRRMTVESLKAHLVKRYRDKSLVLAHAIRTANRLQKVRRHPDFYGLKDRWVQLNQDNLTLGRIARREVKSCWTCGGTGVWNGTDMGDDCYRCDGTGIYSSRSLFEHQFEIAGQRFVFHSYVRPHRLSEECAADCDTYGRPFQPDELPCPPQDVLVGLIRQALICDGNQGDLKCDVLDSEFVCPTSAACPSGVGVP